MPQRIKEEDIVNDGRWTILPDIGSVRTGPRGRRFWDSVSHQWGNGQSDSAGNLDQDDHTTFLPLTHHEMSLMERFSNEQGRRRQNPDDEIGPVRSSEAAYRDSRRAPAHNRRVKHIKEEDEDEDSVLFCGQHTVGQSIRPPIRPPTPPPTPPEELPEEETPLPLPECRCPIHLECGVREDDHIDCRRLVPYWRTWRAAQQGYVPPGMPADEEDIMELFANPVQLAEIVQLLQAVATTALGADMHNLLGRIRAWIFTMQTIAVRENDVNATQVIPALEQFLSDANRPQRQAKHVPYDISEDLTIILYKWQFGDFGVHPRRGLLRNANGRWIPNPNWPFRRPGQRFGHQHLVNGQIFGSRLQLYVEGGHAATIAGIAGTTEDGAYSIVMGLHEPKKKNVYADVDCGEEIYYMSTALKPIPGELPTNVMDPADEALDNNEARATRGAKALMRSFQTGEGVRLFRSWKLAEIVPHRPEWGYRYDGLYRVVDYECLKKRRQIYRFKMVRLREGQGPLRTAQNQEAQANKTTKRKTKNEERREGEQKRRRGN